MCPLGRGRVGPLGVLVGLVLARERQEYLRWRNANARYADALVAQRRERVRSSERR
ncbi:hypothetical protein GCM10023085_56180 [Actinomadura viridis]